MNYNEPDRITDYEERADRRADEYLEDCKVLAMYVRQYHEPDPQEYFFDDNLHTQICVCPACTIAKKISGAISIYAENSSEGFRTKKRGES